MLTILVRMKILTDALASVASVWIRACLNWIEFARIVTGIQENKQPNVTENMLLEFAGILSSLNLTKEEERFGRSIKASISNRKMA
jgi:hypothetical protein